MPEKSLSFASVGTTAGGASCVILIVNVVQDTTGWYERWFGLVIAVLLSLFATFFSRDSVGVKAIVSTALLAILNGFVIYATAFGIHQTVIAEDTPPAEAMVASEPESPSKRWPTYISPHKPSIDVFPPPMREPPKDDPPMREWPREDPSDAPVGSAKPTLPERSFRSPW